MSIKNLAIVVGLGAGSLLISSCDTESNQDSSDSLYPHSTKEAEGIANDHGPSVIAFDRAIDHLIHTDSYHQDISREGSLVHELTVLPEEFRPISNEAIESALVNIDLFLNDEERSNIDKSVEELKTRSSKVIVAKVGDRYVALFTNMMPQEMHDLLSSILMFNGPRYQEGNTLGMDPELLIFEIDENGGIEDIGIFDIDS